jgi:hypothetical protein
MLRHKLAGDCVLVAVGAAGLGVLLVAPAGRKSGPVLVLGVGVAVGVAVAVSDGEGEGDADTDGRGDASGSVLGNGLVLAGAVADGLGAALGAARVSGWHW